MQRQSSFVIAYASRLGFQRQQRCNNKPRNGFWMNLSLTPRHDEAADYRDDLESLLDLGFRSKFLEKQSRGMRWKHAACSRKDLRSSTTWPKYAVNKINAT
jgi:hypothetical protein